MEKNISQKIIWQRIIELINAADIAYVIVGAAALVIHGLPRTTLDLDIYVAANENTLKKLFKVADKLGLKSQQREILNISNSPKLFSGQWVCFSDQGRDVLDVFLAREEEFNNLYKKAEIKKDKDLSLRVASLNDIIKMKRASGRPADLADLELIKEVKKFKL